MSHRSLSVWRARRAPLGAAAVLTTLTTLVVLSAVASAQVLQQRIANPVPAANADYSWFGAAVDISGDALIVGAPSHPFEQAAASGVAIYERSGGTWSLVLDLLQSFPDDAQAGWDVAIDGEWAAFNVFDSPGGALNSGEVRIYRRIAGNWVAVQTLTAANPWEQFGNAIDIDGELMVVGSALQDLVFLYRLQAGVWTEIAFLQPPPQYVQADSHFGESVAVSDLPSREVVLVGQPFYSPFVGQDDGAAHIYVKDLFGWTAQNPMQPSSFNPDDSWFGFRVALDGDFAVVGAVRLFETMFPSTGNGYASIYRWNGNSFPLSKEILGEPGEHLGWAVAADGDRVYVSRPLWTGIDSGSSLDAGRVTADRWTGSAWTPWPANGGSFQRIANPVIDTYFGEALAAADGRLVVGMPEADIAGVDQAGSICVLDVSKEGWKWSDAEVGGLDTVVGSTGPARLIGEGSLGGGDGYRLHLHDARPNTLVAMFVGLSALNAPFKGGVLVPNPQYTLWFPTNAAGNFHVTTTFPNGVPAGVTLWHHMWWPDPAAPAGVASSNAIRGITP